MPLMQLSALMVHFWILPVNLGKPQAEKLPWNSEKWMKATGVHSGLFPDDVSVLPKYMGWSVADKNAVLRLFNTALNKKPADVWKMMAHPPNELKSAVKIWADAWKKMWERTGAFLVIEDILIKSEFHPHLTMVAEGLDKFPTRPSSMGTCPQDIADTIFGTEISLRQSRDGVPMLTFGVSEIIDYLISTIWHRLNVKTSRIEKNMEKLETRAVERFKSLFSMHC